MKQQVVLDFSDDGKAVVQISIVRAGWNQQG
jgi:hypothetical protein